MLFWALQISLSLSGEAEFVWSARGYLYLRSATFAPWDRDLPLILSTPSGQLSPHHALI
jgi:hypothetical protein